MCQNTNSNKNQEGHRVKKNKILVKLHRFHFNIATVVFFHVIQRSKRIINLPIVFSYLGYETAHSNCLQYSMQSTKLNVNVFQ